MLQLGQLINAVLGNNLIFTGQNARLFYVTALNLK
jgi:hypothetical protein